MREILFRGKRADNKEWVIGDSLVHSMYKKGDVCVGVVEGLEIYSVIPETVGQYTGLTDKNGNKIFEGDIVRDKTSGVAGKIVYCNESAMFIKKAVLRSSLGNPFSLEVIGNIHDNPQLLGGEQG